jgi:hypothetical protein
MPSELRKVSTPDALAARPRVPGAAVPESEGSDTGRRLVEIRAYRLKAGARTAFRTALVERALPMVRTAGMDVVAHGPGADEDSYFLVRAFADAADLAAREEAFYSSAAWREGPRESVVSLIDSYIDTLLWLTPRAVEDLRRANGTSA